MKKIISAMIIITLLMTTGCSMDPTKISPPYAEEVNNLVLIIDKTRYAPQYDLEKLLGDEIAKYYCKKKDKITVICPDGSGNPSSKTFAFNGTNKKVDKSSMQRVIAKENKVVLDYVKEVKPMEKELSLVPALALAASELAADDTAIGRIYLITGGLTTVAPLNMRDGLDIDVESTVSALRYENLIPDLRGVSVNVYGLGYVAPGKEQDSLSGKEKELLISFYEEFFSAANANCTVHSNIPDSGDGIQSAEESPYVTPVIVGRQKDALIRTPDEILDDSVNDTYDLSTEVIKLPEGILNYKPGSDEFLLSKDEVARLLSPIAEWYRRNPYQMYVFSGTASCGSEKELMALSKKRGNAVREVLIGLGVDEDHISVVPMGYALNPYRQIDTVGGVFNEEAAKQNRVTYIMSADNPAMSEFKEALEY